MVAAGEPWSPPAREFVPGDGAGAIYAEQEIYFDKGFLKSPLYRRDLLSPGDTIEGPAMITEYTSATILPPGAIAKVDGYGNVVITFTEEATE